MKIDNKFNLGDIIFLKTDVDQKPRMIIAMEVYLEGEIMYKVISGTFTSYHYEMEMATEKNILI